MSTYTVKPLNYDGCNKVIKEHLLQCKAILCSVGSTTDCHLGDEEDYIIGYNAEDKFYIGEEDNYLSAIPKEKILYWKKASGIVKFLEEHSYYFSKSGKWLGPLGTRSFYASILSHSGEKVTALQEMKFPRGMFEEK